MKHTTLNKFFNNLIRKNKNTRLLDKCRQHYNKMINKIVDTEIPDNYFDFSISLVIRGEIISGLIGEIWTAHYCACCKKYLKKYCKGCPLNEVENCKNENSTWKKINKAKNKEELLKALLNMRKLIERVMDDYLKKDKRKIYVVTMYRYGDRDRHSYVHGVFLKKQLALNEAEEEKESRGGNKYYPEVLEFSPNCTEEKVILELEFNPDFCKKEIK